MKLCTVTLLFCLLFIGYSTLSAAELRQWTGSNGKIIEAEVLGLEEDVVKIKLKNGREMNVLLSKFAEKDQERIRQMTSPEDPFADAVIEEYPQEVIRVTIDINEKGEGTFRVEKSNAPPQDEFNGKEAKSRKPNSQNLKFWTRDDGLQKIVFDYRDPEVCEWFGKAEGSPPLRIVRGANWNVVWGKGMSLIHFPLKIIFDAVPLEDGECACIEMVYNLDGVKTENKGVFQFHVYNTKELLKGKVDVFGEWTSVGSAPKDIPFEELPKSILVQKNGIDLNTPFTATFRIPVSDPDDLKGRFAFGRNLGRPKQEKHRVTNPCAVQYFELIGKLGL